MQHTKIGSSEDTVLNHTCLVFGQMNEPPGARLRVALTAMTMAEFFCESGVGDTLLSSITYSGSRSRLGSIRASRSYPVGGRLPAHLWRRDGTIAGTYCLHEDRLDHVRAGHLCPADDSRPGAGYRVYAPRFLCRAKPGNNSERYYLPLTRSKAPRVCSNRISSGKEHYGNAQTSSNFYRGIRP